MRKFLTELGPLLVFFIFYKFYGIITATIAMVITTIITIAINFYFEKKVSFIPLISALILIFFGTLTIYTGNSKFVKMKPTIVNIFFASILIGGAFFQKGLLKYLLGGSIKLPESAWIKLSIRWGMFFIILALLNEFLWRNYDEATWVKFKVFGIIPLTIIFMLTQIPFLSKNRIED